MKRNESIRRFIDRRVQYWCEFYDTYYDAGVKGMKKGQHVMARDPEYVQELKGGGGSNPAQNKSAQRPSALKRAAVVGGSLAGAAGLSLLGSKVGGKLGRKMAGKVASAGRKTQSLKSGSFVGGETIKPKPASHSYDPTMGAPMYHGNKSFGGFKKGYSQYSEKETARQGYEQAKKRAEASRERLSNLVNKARQRPNFEQIKKRLNNPNYVWDI